MIEELAEVAVRQTQEDIQKNTVIPSLEEQLRDTENSIENIIAMIEKGVASDRLAKRLTQLERDQRDLQRRLERERKNVVILEKPIVIHWLKQFSHGDIEEASFRRQLIDLLVNSVTVWDEPDGWFKITTVYNLLKNNRKTIKVKMPPTPSPATDSGGSDSNPIGSPLEANPNPIIVMGMVFAQTRKHRQP